MALCRETAAAAPAPTLEETRVELGADGALIVEAIAPGTGERTAYAVHCVPPDFPEVEVVGKAPGRAPGLLPISPWYSSPVKLSTPSVAIRQSAPHSTSPSWCPSRN